MMEALQSLWLRASLRIGDLKEDLKSERGVTTIEYAVMLVLVAIAVILMTPNLRAAIIGVFGTITTELNNANP